MFRSKIRFVFFLIFYCQACFYLTASEPFFTKKETLYSVKTGNPVGELSFNIEIKSMDVNPKELYLIIGDKGNEIFESEGDKKTLWIFGNNMSASELKKDLKNKDYSVDIKDIHEFVSFCENDIRFDLKNWEEIKKQTKFSFYVNSSVGEKITLRLHFYIASKNKKKPVIDDEAKVKLEFPLLLPSPARNEKKQQEEESISLTERLNQSAKAIQKQQEDSLKQAEEKERIQRTNTLNVLITVKNKEIISLLDDINQLSSEEDAKITENTIDSLEVIVDSLRKKVDYLDKSYTDILLNNEALQNKFIKFGADQTAVSKKLNELRQQQIEKKNIWKDRMIYIGIGLAALMLGGMFLTQLWNMAKMKRQLRKQQKMMEEEERKRAFESIDIKDLDEI